jgi:DNA repair protein RecO (recombination protein O)
MEKALALVVRTTDWSESSRIATLFTREFGKVRVLAKGGRRLKSNFETALDLLTVCSIVWLRKSSGGLDLLTEAQVVERFPKLRTNLPALYAGYYVAELLSDWTQDYDPHEILFDAARDALRDFGAEGLSTALRLAAFELTLLRELGYSPVLAACAVCGRDLPDDEPGLAFCPAVGGLACRECQPAQRERMPIGVAARRLLRDLGQPGEPWRVSPTPATRVEIRRLLGQYVTWLMGHRPRLLPYLNHLS